jgi:hypothetical protein
MGQNKSKPRKQPHQRKDGEAKTTSFSSLLSSSW